jgi:hypothetical protein
MGPDRIPEELMDYTPRGTRSIGRLKLRWKDQTILQRNGTDRKVQQTLMLIMIMIMMMMMMMIIIIITIIIVFVLGGSFPRFIHHNVVQSSCFSHPRYMFSTPCRYITYESMFVRPGPMYLVLWDVRV